MYRKNIQRIRALSVHEGAFGAQGGRTSHNIPPPPVKDTPLCRTGRGKARKPEGGRVSAPGKREGHASAGITDTK